MNLWPEFKTQEQFEEDHVNFIYATHFERVCASNLVFKSIQERVKIEFDARDCRMLTNKVKEEMMSFYDQSQIQETVIDSGFLDLQSHKILTEAPESEFFQYLIEKISQECAIPDKLAVLWVTEYFRFLVLTSLSPKPLCPSYQVELVWKYH